MIGFPSSLSLGCGEVLLRRIVELLEQEKEYSLVTNSSGWSPAQLSATREAFYSSDGSRLF